MVKSLDVLWVMKRISVKKSLQLSTFQVVSHDTAGATLILNRQSQIRDRKSSQFTIKIADTHTQT